MIVLRIIYTGPSTRPHVDYYVYHVGSKKDDEKSTKKELLKHRDYKVYTLYAYRYL